MRIVHRKDHAGDDMKRSALFTGSTGFTGGNLVRRLVNDGWQVHVIVRQDSDQAQKKALNDLISIHVHDGTTEQMRSIIGATQPDMIFHLATMFLPDHKPEEIVPLIQNNFVFATQLADAMVDHGVQHFINTGTFWQHYDNKEYNPVCLYAAIKQAFEAVLQYYIDAYGIKVITLTLFDIYGPDDPRDKLFKLLERAADKQETLKMTPGEQLVDLVYIDDVIDAYMLAADLLETQDKGTSRTFTVSSGTPVILKDVVKLYSDITGKIIPVEWGGKPYRPREVMMPWNSGKHVPGWSPKVGLKEGIRLITGKKA